MSIKENLKNIKSSIPEHVTLVAVSKTKPVSDLMEDFMFFKFSFMLIVIY